MAEPEKSPDLEKENLLRKGKTLFRSYLSHIYWDYANKQRILSNEYSTDMERDTRYRQAENVRQDAEDVLVSFLANLRRNPTPLNREALQELIPEMAKHKDLSVIVKRYVNGIKENLGI